MALNVDGAFRRAVSSSVRRARKLRDASQEEAEDKISVFVWTVDDRKEMTWLARSGVDGVITNRPDILSKVVKKVKAKKT